MEEHTDILITHSHLFTLQGEGVGYVPDGAVAVKGSVIAAVGSSAELTARFRASETIDASDCAVLPGLIDAHMHTPWAIVRGVAQDVKHWMQRALAPYTRHITPEAALAGSRLNVLEAVKAGTTISLITQDPFLAGRSSSTTWAFAPDSPRRSTRCHPAAWRVGRWAIFTPSTQ